jgi:hypothetical protein
MPGKLELLNDARGPFLLRQGPSATQGHQCNGTHNPRQAALPPMTDVGRHIQVSIWLSLYEYTPLG